MSDTISRQVAVDAVNKIVPVNTEYDCVLLDILDVRYVLKELPSAKHKTGKWILWGGMDIPENHGRHKCSECREFALRWYDKPIVREHLSDFCPHCGADMRGEQE